MDRLREHITVSDRIPIGDAFVSFIEGGPPGRPQLDGELFA